MLGGYGKYNITSIEDGIIVENKRLSEPEYKVIVPNLTPTLDIKKAVDKTIALNNNRLVNKIKIDKNILRTNYLVGVNATDYIVDINGIYTLKGDWNVTRLSSSTVRDSGHPIAGPGSASIPMGMVMTTPSLKNIAPVTVTVGEIKLNKKASSPKDTMTSEGTIHVENIHDINVNIGDKCVINFVSGIDKCIIQHIYGKVIKR